MSGLLGLPAVDDVSVWLSAAMTDVDRALACAQPQHFRARVRGRDLTLRMLALHPGQQWLATNVAANPLLWFLHHGMWDLSTSNGFGDPERVALKAYAAVNDAFAGAVVEEIDRCGPGVVVMSHDYQLYLVAPAVRALRPDAVLHHFVHVPWPSPDNWSRLPAPWAARLVLGLLANDVVAFHTKVYVEHFLACCEEIVGAVVDHASDEVVLDGRRIAVRAYPLAPYPPALRSLALSGEVRSARDALRRPSNNRLVVRVDRADPTKNVLRGFEAWERLLEAHPEHRGRTTFRAVLQPTRQDIPVYRDYLAATLRAVGELNARWGTSQWQPVEVVLSTGHVAAVAALQEYDVLLVNAERDGMNLVAKEGVLLNERDGVLVLSRTTGAHEQLAPWALSVDPLDVGDQAAALHRALTMAPAERWARLAAARACVERYDGSWWYAQQQRDLAALQAENLRLSLV